MAGSNGDGDITQYPDLQTPFGRVKDSGHAREGGSADVERPAGSDRGERTSPLPFPARRRYRTKSLAARVSRPLSSIWKSANRSPLVSPSMMVEDAPPSVVVLA